MNRQKKFHLKINAPTRMRRLVLLVALVLLVPIGYAIAAAGVSNTLVSPSSTTVNPVNSALESSILSPSSTTVNPVNSALTLEPASASPVVTTVNAVTSTVTGQIIPTPRTVDPITSTRDGVVIQLAAPASITLAPASGPAGSLVEVNGTSFAANSAVTIKFDGTALSTTPSAVTTDSTGNFTATITVPSAAAIGPHTITAEDAAANSASAQFEVTVPPVVPLSPNKDSFIRQDRSNVNDGANPQLQVRRTDTQRTLIAFNQTDITQASQGKTLQSATLKMFITENSNSWGSGRTIELRLLRTDWTEGNGQYTLNGFRGTGAGVTWNCPTDTNIANNDRNCSSSWGGGSFVSTVSVKKTITNGLLGWVEFDVTNDVKSFLAGTTNNFGWIIKKTQEDRSGHVFFSSGEATSNQPILELRYS